MLYMVWLNMKVERHRCCWRLNCWLEWHRDESGDAAIDDVKKKPVVVVEVVGMHGTSSRLYHCHCHQQLLLRVTKKQVRCRHPHSGYPVVVDDAAAVANFQLAVRP